MNRSSGLKNKEWIGIVLFLGLAIIHVCQAQVNFSKDWGKRSTTTTLCKPPLYTMGYILNILQMEIDKMMECGKTL